MGSEFPFSDRFPLKRKRFVAKLLNAILEPQFVIVNARKVFAVQLPSVDELFEWENRVIRC